MCSPLSRTHCSCINQQNEIRITKALEKYWKEERKDLSLDFEKDCNKVESWIICVICNTAHLYEIYK